MNSLKKQLKFLNLVPSSIQKRELLQGLIETLASGDFILGPQVNKFENNFAKYLGAKYCIGVGNGLEAIQISLMALEIGVDDEVITTPVSAVATTLAILAVGAKPVFVDTDMNGLIDTDLISHAMTKKTKAILPVHLYGNPVNVDKIQTICKENNLFIIEDAAQAHGTTFNNKKLGTFGDFGCFSFYPTKNLGAFGDGGAIVTDNKKLALICREIRDYGQQKKYLHKRYGLNSRLDEIQAAFLNTKLGYLEKENAKRRILAKRYFKCLSNIPDIEMVKPQNIDDANFHIFVIKTKKRNQLKKYLAENGIQTLIHYPVIIPNQPFFKKKYGETYLPSATDFVKTCLSLPLNPNLTFKEVDFICSKIVKFYS